MLWQGVFGAFCRWLTARPSKMASQTPSPPSRRICSKTPKRDAYSALLNRRADRWLWLRVETADDARIQPRRRCSLARRVGLRIEGLRGASTQPQASERDAA